MRGLPSARFLHTTLEVFSGFFPAPVFLSPLAAAIDISESSVKYLSLVRKGHLLVPDVFLQVPVPEGVMKSGEIVKVDELQKILKGIAVRCGGGEVYVSLPEEFAYIYPVVVGGSQSAELIKTAVEFSLTEHVPLPSQQIVYDSVAIPGASGKSRFVSVTGYDAKKSESYLEVVTRAGFTVRALETEVHAAVRSCIPADTIGTTLLFDVGRTRTGITAVLNGIPISTSTIEEGGKCTTEALLGIAGGDAAKAEELKVEHGLRIIELHPEVKVPLMLCMNRWSESVKEYIQFLNGAHPNSEVPIPPISKVILCGGEAAMPGFAEWVAAEIGMPVEMGNVWGQLFSYGEYIPAIPKNTSLRLATTVGLALRNLHE